MPTSPMRPTFFTSGAVAAEAVAAGVAAEALEGELLVAGAPAVDAPTVEALATRALEDALGEGSPTDEAVAAVCFCEVFDIECPLLLGAFT